VRYRISVGLDVAGTPAERDEAFDHLADAFFDLHEVADQDLGANVATGRFEVSMIVEADGLEDAVGKSLAAVRAAIHAVGGATPRWDKAIKEIGAEACELADA
jgi:hypothetical protein